MLKLDNRKTWLGMALLLTVLAAIWPTQRSDAPVGPERQHGRHDSTEEIKIEFHPLGRVASKALALNNLFPSQTWMPPPPLVRQKPEAPPLPFTFEGRYMEDGKTMIFLSEAGQFIKARQGDRIGSAYRIDKIDASVITFTYLPLGTKQTLTTGDSMP